MKFFSIYMKEKEYIFIYLFFLLLDSNFASSS